LVHPVVLLVTVIDTGTSLKEDTNISTGEDSSLDKNLEGHKQLEGNLVSFEETSVNVSVDFLGESLDNVVNTVLDKLGLGRVRDGVVEESEELLERGVVHPVDLDHLDDTEVEDGSTGGNRSELFTLVTNFGSLLTSLSKFVSDLTRLELNVSEHINELNIIEEGALGVSKTLKETSLKIGEDLGVRSDLLLELGKSFFERLLLEGNQTTEKLLFETTLGDSEINNSSLGSEFGRVMGVSETGSHVQGELLVEVEWLSTTKNEGLFTATLGDVLLFENGIEQGVDFILN